MDCPKCGEEIPDKSAKCPRCGDNIEPATDQQAKNLKEKLKAKIKECYRDQKLSDALNFIDIYMSTIGIDKEIYQLRSKILQEKSKKSLRQEGGPDNRESSAFEELINDSIVFGADQESAGASEAKEAKKDSPTEGRPEAAAASADDDFYSNSTYDLVLGTNEEVYGSEKEKDEPVVEMAEESPFKITDYHDFTPPVKEDQPEPGPHLEQEIPDVIRSAEPEIELPEIESPEIKRYRPVKKKNKLVVFGTLGVAAALMIATAVYFFNPFGMKKRGNDQTTSQTITPPPVHPRLLPGSQKRPSEMQQSPIRAAAALPPLDIQFNRYLGSAKAQYQKGNFSQAQSDLIFAKRIKSTDELNDLEGKILSKLKEMDNSPSIDEVNEKVVQLKDDRTFERSLATNTIPAYEEYLRLFPAGQHTQEARKKIGVLEKKRRQNFEDEMAQKVQSLQEVKLRPLYKNLSLVDIEADAGRFNNFTSRIEEMTIDEEKVVIDFATGLMWHLWEKPMFFDKAQWWAARRYSGYYDWRLPTADEALSLARIEQSHFPYPRPADYDIWTGDLDSQNARSSWTLNLGSRKFNSTDFYKLRYVFSVRAVKR